MRKKGNAIEVFIERTGNLKIDFFPLKTIILEGTLISIGDVCHHVYRHACHHSVCRLLIVSMGLVDACIRT